uniref:Ribosomal RNA methyltransferase SPB1-like C-terminal domain-containing protein n=2 Tax=Picocystis salinarum TaxID=88271 RepID=A0A6U9RG70_9CHLO
MKELTEAKEIAERKLRQKKKREAKLKQKEKVKRLLRTTGDAGIEQDVELFDLGTIARKQDLEHLEKDQEELHASDEGQELETDGDEGTDSDPDSEAEEAYQASVEKALDALYERQLEGTDSKSASRKRRRARIGEMELEADVSTGNGEMPPSRSATGMLARAGEQEEDDAERNPLLLDMEEDPSKPTPKAVTVKWFSQDVFKDVEPELDEEGEGTGNGKKARPGSMSMPGDVEDSEEDSPSEEETDPQPGDPSEQHPDLQRDRGDFEVVPQERLRGSDDSSSSDTELGDVEDMDDDTRAEILAYGKKMLRRKDRENIIDASYNRYVFHDQDLPAWFVEDEKKYMQPQKPITKEEFMDAKTQLRAIDSRAIHKVAEAKARKRKRLVRRMDKARKKAGGIAEQEDMPVAAKAREIKKLYSQAKKGVYNKTSSSKKKKGRGSENTSKRPLDRRLLADQRGRGGKKAGGGKGGKKGRR